MPEYRPDPKSFPNMWNYKPDDTESSFYIEGSKTYSEILEQANEKWPEGFKDILIEPMYIHTRCLTYDLYDSSDYDNYLLITRCI